MPEAVSDTTGATTEREPCDCEAEDGPPLPPLPEPAWLPAARAEGERPLALAGIAAADAPA